MNNLIHFFISKENTILDIRIEHQTRTYSSLDPLSENLEGHCLVSHNFIQFYFQIHSMHDTTCIEYNLDWIPVDLPFELFSFLIPFSGINPTFMLSKSKRRRTEWIKTEQLTKTESISFQNTNNNVGESFHTQTILSFLVSSCLLSPNWHHQQSE